MIGPEKIKPSAIKEVLSQAPALAQCELWLDKHLPHAIREETQDTADSVRLVVKQKKTASAAIASRQAAELYGGKIIAGPINDYEHNYTRFFLLSQKPETPKSADKTSIILETGHIPGALYKALGIFADANVNLTKLNSQPIPGDRWHYAFYIDFMAALKSDIAQEIIEKLQNLGCKVAVLGSYKAADMPS